MENIVNLPASTHAVDHASSTSETLAEETGFTPVIHNTPMVAHGEADPSPYAKARHVRSNSSASRHSPLVRSPTKELVDRDLDINLPYRTLSANANLAEYLVAVPSGEIPGPPKPDGGHYKLVTFLPGDKENPKNWSHVYKWYCTMVVAATCFVVAFSSSVITPDIADVAEEFGVSEEVALLSISLFVVGFGVGE